MSESLTERLLEVREELRAEMIRQPVTDERDTYSDGYGQGLATAIDAIGRILSPRP